jgi:uncharacterized coiled-coil protein SlyX
MHTSIPLRHIEARPNPVLQLLVRRSLFSAVIILGCFALSPLTKAQVQCREGCDIAKSNAFLGPAALNPATTGTNSTAIGDRALEFNTTGSANTASGSAALQNNSSGQYNTASGFYALNSNYSASDNTASGAYALAYNDGSNNTASGAYALRNNTTGSENTAVGASALFGSTDVGGAGISTGIANTATGFEALYSNKDGDANVADGAFALENNTTGDWNTAIGTFALRGSTDANGIANSTGSYNTASGYEALLSNSTGYDNVATGFQSLHDNTTGKLNTASGVQALYYNTTGSNNTAMGLQALLNNNGLNNTALGYQAGLNLTTGSNNIVIGAGVLGKAGEANATRIGKSTQAATYITGIYSKGVASATGVPVKIDSTGKLGTVLSSARYKDHIKPMDKASEAILQLAPVTFQYKKDLDPDGVPQFGLIAEQVEKVDPDLVIRDEEGKVSTVRYEAVNVMLLNEFLKERRTLKTVQAEAGEQHATITELKSITARQQKEIEALTTRLHNVSDRLEVVEPKPRLARSN